MVIRRLPPNDSRLLGGAAYELPWDGTPLTPYPFLAFDCETELIRPGRIPRLALVTVTNGHRHVFVQPGKQLADFVRAHSKTLWVGFNVSFDWWVVKQDLATVPDAPVDEWYGLVDAGRLHDAMLLDFLVRLGEGKDPNLFGMRNLGQVAMDWLGVAVDKESTYRTRYAELIGVDWGTVQDPGWWEYAITDTIATWHLARELYPRALDLATHHQVPEELIARYGPLTETLQVQAAVVLAEAGRRGMALDTSRIAVVRRQLEERINAEVDFLHKNYPGVFSEYKVNGKGYKKGDLKRNQSTGVPRLQTEPLRQYLREVAQELNLVVEEMPRTEKTNQLTTAIDPWREVAGTHPLVASWARLQDTAKTLQFVVKLDGKGAVHPSYQVLVRTGRTSCRDPNIQQMPRESWFREMFVARPGHKLGIIDYAAIELRTLAAVCLDRYGFSVLADTIKAGRDPHAYTAAMIRGEDYETFLTLKTTDPKAFKTARQAAKAVNFGVPGGLGAGSLRDYARLNYGVALSEEEAKGLRSGLVTKVYPELERYLADSVPERMARALGCTVEELSRRLEIPLSEESAGLWRGVVRVLRGTKRRSDGTYMSPGWRTRVIDTLADLCCDPGLRRQLMSWGLGPDLERRLCSDVAITLTGRVRASLGYCEARNTPFQALAADGAKVALYRLWRRGFSVVAFVHDEVVLELPVHLANESLREAEEIMKTSMAEVLRCNIPVEVESALSERWVK